MPKIIENLEEKIFDAAFELFGHYGYQEVDMKKIAKKVGIAVGTLYNYYPNKKQLFINVFKKSWEDTFVKIDKVMEDEISSKEKLKKCINVLYDEMHGRNGLGRELISEKVFGENSKNVWVCIKKEFFKRTDLLLSDMKKEEGIDIETQFEGRLIKTIGMSITTLLAEYSEEREENIKFLNYLIDCTLSKN